MGLVGQVGQVGRMRQMGRIGRGENFELGTSCKLAPAGGKRLYMVELVIQILRILIILKIVLYIRMAF